MHPDNSWLWKTPCFCSLLKRADTITAVADSCQYGSQSKKPIRLVFVGGCVQPLSFLRCSGEHGRCNATQKPHIVLSGSSGHGFITAASVSVPKLLAFSLVSYFSLPPPLVPHVNCGIWVERQSLLAQTFSLSSIPKSGRNGGG